MKADSVLIGFILLAASSSVSGKAATGSVDQQQQQQRLLDYDLSDIREDLYDFLKDASEHIENLQEKYEEAHKEFKKKITRKKEQNKSNVKDLQKKLQKDQEELRETCETESEERCKEKTLKVNEESSKRIEELAQEFNEETTEETDELLEQLTKLATDCAADKLRLEQEMNYVKKVGSGIEDFDEYFEDELEDLHEIHSDYTALTTTVVDEMDILHGALFSNICFSIRNGPHVLKEPTLSRFENAVADAVEIAMSALGSPILISAATTVSQTYNPDGRRQRRQLSAHNDRDRGLAEARGTNQVNVLLSFHCKCSSLDPVSDAFRRQLSDGQQQEQEEQQPDRLLGDSKASRMVERLLKQEVYNVFGNNDVRINTIPCGSIVLI